MVRKITVVMLGAIAALIPAWVSALGLGEIKLNSYLNQPLDAEIELLSASGEDIDSMRVALASSEAFARAGIEYLHTLKQLQFRVYRKDSGKAFVKVTSKEDFREPFLNFILELNFSKGRLFREYTLLIDPPVFTSGSPSATQAPATSGNTSTETGRASDSAGQAGDPDLFPRIPLNKEQRGTNPSAVGSSRAATGSVSATGDSYGPIQRNESLWKIAERVRADGVSVEQMMLALLNDNPEAFIDDNINQLKAGRILRIPDVQKVSALPDWEARAEVARQYQVWKTKRTRISDSGRNTQSPGSTNSRATEPVQQVEGSLELLAPEEGADSLEVAQGGTPDAAAMANLRKQTALAKEAAEAQRQENEELRSRISELETQITNANRLADLKNEQLAALQKTLAELQNSSDADSQPQAETSLQQAAEATVPEVETPAAEEAMEEASPDAVAPAEELAQPGIEPEVAPAAEVAQLPDSETPEVVAEQPVLATPAVEEAAAEGESLWDWITNNMLLLLLAAGSVVLAVLGVMLIRQRRNAYAGFEESILQDKEIFDETVDETIMREAISSNHESGDSETPSYLSDFSVSQMDTSSFSEVSDSDPLTEADVFLAYGRFQPAESMISDAIEKEPERKDLKLKLLEIYFAAKNKEAFAEQAAVMQPDLATDQEIWAKVQEMGLDLCPDNALFSAADETAFRPSGDETEFRSMGDETEFRSMGDETEFRSMGDETEFQPTGDETAFRPAAGFPGDEETALYRPNAHALDQELDMDMNSKELDMSDDATEIRNTDSDNLIDFDLGGTGEDESKLDFDSEETARFDAPPSAELDIDFAADDATLDQPASSLDDEIPEDFDLGAFNEPKAKPDASSNVIEFEPLKAADDGLEFESQTADFSSDVTAESLDDLKLGDDDLLASIDEVGTKLDLAKAYIDMGDPEGARCILDEVMEEGNDDQKNEATQLQQQL